MLLHHVSTIIKMSIWFTLCVSALSPSASPTRVVPLSFLHSVCPPPRSVTSPQELALIPDRTKCVLYHHPPQGRSKHLGLSCAPHGGLRLCRKPLPHDVEPLVPICLCLSPFLFPPASHPHTQLQNALLATQAGAAISALIDS